jgi:hypothetical protein
VADPTFDGTTKVITLNSGQVELDVVQLYSSFKRWVSAGNAQYLPAFAPVGGETIDATAGTSVPLYAFLINGWRVKPQEANHTLNVTNGILLVDGGGDPFVNTTGSYVVRVNYQQPVQAITVSTGGAAAGLTPTQEARLNDLWTFLGLDASDPVTIAPTGHSSVLVDVGITDNGDGSVTLQRA